MISGRQLPLTPRPKPGLANSPRMINDVAGNDWPGLVIFKLWIISTDSLPPSPALPWTEQSRRQSLRWLRIYNQPNYPGAAWLEPAGRPTPELQIKTSGWPARDGQYEVVQG